RPPALARPPERMALARSVRPPRGRRAGLDDPLPTPRQRRYGRRDHAHHGHPAALRQLRRSVAHQHRARDRHPPERQRAEGEGALVEARQRWRLTVARDEQAAELAERDTLEALADGFVASRLPLAVAGSARPRPRVALAASLPHGTAGGVELVEVYLAERLPGDEMLRRI